MKNKDYRRIMMAAIFLLPMLASHAGVPTITSDERVLFSERNYPTKPSGFRGGKVELSPESRFMKIVFSQAGAGAGIRTLLGSTRFDPIPYLGDPFPAVEVTFRSTGTPPESLSVVLGTLNMSVKPAMRKSVQTRSVPVAAATELGDGWKLLRFQFEGLSVITAKTDSEKEKSQKIRLGKDPSSDIGSPDLIEQVQLVGSSPGEIEVKKISFVRLRNLSAVLKNPPSENTTKLEIEGCVSEPAAEVTLRLVDDSGKTQEKKVLASDGKYRFTWDNPPVSPGKKSSLQTSVAGGKTPENQSVPLNIFGYLTDTQHVWLSVKGRDIVTSPHSKNGEQPFYPVGARYGRNVIVRGYDEEVAAYCKTMGLNTLRLAFYTTHFNNRAQVPLAFDDITAFIDPVLEAARRYGLYVILDDHAYFKNEIDEETARSEQKSSGWTEERFQNWVDRWVQVAGYYKDEPYILGYELCNEPVCDPETARKWYKHCIDAIRKVDKRHIILVGTHHWSHSRALGATWEGVADKIDAPYNNVVFAFHDYPLDNNPWEVQAYLRAFQKQYDVPVLCTEFGGGGKPELVHREFQSGMLSMFAFERVGWMIWALNYVPDQATGFPTRATQNPEDKSWSVQTENPGYWIPFVDLWAPAAKIMASVFPEPASNSKNP